MLSDNNTLISVYDNNISSVGGLLFAMSDFELRAARNNIFSHGVYGRVPLSDNLSSD